MIERVLDEKYTNICDELLTKLIISEREYDDSIDQNFIVKDYFKNIIKNENNYLLIYILDNKVVGYIFLKYMDKYYLIDGLYVLEDYRNRHIARQLLDESINIIKNTSINKIQINVMSNNIIAKKLYKKYGFNEFKLTMQKDLYKEE